MRNVLNNTVLLLAHPSSSVFHNNEAHDHAVAIAHDMIHEESSSSIGIPVSPSCWATAIALLGSPGTDAASFCANLPETSQKRLALELARCHMEDVQKPLFHSPRKAQECTKTSPLSSNESLRSCLSGLTDSGEHAYTHYMPYLQALCTRKTQELFLQHQQSIKDDLASEYAKLSRASMDHMKFVHQATAKHAEELNAKLADIPAVIHSRITEQLGEIVRKELGDRLATAMQQQTTEQSSVFQEILSSIQLQDLERKKQHDDWNHYQSGMFLKQAKEMERQRDALRESRERIEDLSIKVSKTSTNMQPLIGLEAFMKAATEGYSWISFVLHFLVTFNVVWVVTRPDRCHRFRSYMFAVVVTEAVIEFVLKGATTHAFIDEMGRIGLTTELRRLALLLECIIYLAGLLTSFCAASGSTKNEMLLTALIQHHARSSEQPIYQEYEDCFDDGTMSYSQQSENRSPRHHEHPLRMQQLHHKGNLGIRSPSNRTHQKIVDSSSRHRHERNARPIVSYVSDSRLSRGPSPPMVSPQTPAPTHMSTSDDEQAFDNTETKDPPPEGPPTILETKPTCGGKRPAEVSPDNEPNSKKAH
jgi:hypothetical protein